MFKYFAFGLTLKSELYFPELFATEFIGESQISIIVGQVPVISAEDNFVTYNNIVFNSRKFYLDIPDIGKYYASEGKSIIIEPTSNCDLIELRLFCLSNVFAALLYQRGVIPIHSAALKIRNSIIMICGQSGSGKSTLLGSLIAKGFLVFSDDVCVPAIYNNEVLISSSYPMMKFWGETIKRMPDLGEPDVQLRPNLQKFGFYFHNQFDKSALKPDYIFFLEKADESAQVGISEVKGYELFQYLESNAYRGEYLGGMDLRKDHFNLFSKLANQIKGFLIKRPDNADTIVQVTDLVIENL